MNNMAHLDTSKVQSNEQQQQNQTEILEYGDIYFFYRPKVRSEQVKGIEDVRRFFMITAPEHKQIMMVRIANIGFSS